MRRYPYWASSVLLLSIFLFTIFYFADENMPVQGPVPPGTTAPFEKINTFYKAVETGDLITARKTVTPALWSALQSQGFFKRWQNLIINDKSLEFGIFLVNEHFLSERDGIAWALGSPDWRADSLHVPGQLETIHLLRVNGQWLIRRIDGRSPVEVASLFYHAVNDGRVKDMQTLTTVKYWDSLVAAGIITAYQQDRRTLPGDVYVVFRAYNFAEGSQSGWVTGSTLWAPTTGRGKEYLVTVMLTKENGAWKINNIIGHWKIGK
ncbi:MAG: hypothetical protein ACYC2T_05625 [Bacillota bacterium]